MPPGIAKLNFIKGEINMKKNTLLAETLEGVKFFADKNNRDVFFAEFLNDDEKTEFVHLNSERFRSFLYAKSFEIADEETALNPGEAVQQLQYLLLHHKWYDEVEVNIRTCGNLNDGIEYDLQRDDQQTVQITAEGWEIAPKENKFVVPKISLPQVMPKRTTSSPLELLKPFVNVIGDMFVIFVVWLIQAFSCGSHHALLVLADRGSGKSTLSKIIKKLIDPCNFEVSTIPNKKDDLVILLYNSFLCCFDNISSISAETSDVFCGAITGTSVAKRALYKDSELTITNLHNTIVINGIGVVPGKDDLAERMLILKLKKLSSTELKTDGNIWQNFDNALPEILGAIFNTLSKAMEEIPNLNLKKLPRMANSFVEMVAIAKALGISEEKFYDIYQSNVETLQQARGSAPIVEAVEEYALQVSGRKIEDTAENTFKNVRGSYSGDKKMLPNSASHFSKQPDEHHEELLKRGVRVNIDDTGAKGTRITIIKKKK